MTLLLLPAAAQSPESARALNDRGYELLGKGEYREARGVFRRALDSFADKRPDMEQARSLAGYAEAVSASDFRMADSLYSRALEIAASRSDESPEYAGILQGLAEVRIMQQRFDGVERMLGRVAEIRKRHGGERSMAYADALSVQGWYYAQKADFARSEEALNHATKIASRIAPESYGHAKILHKAFFLHYYKQDKAAADSCCRRAIAIYGKTAAPADRRSIEIKGNQAIGYIPGRIKEAEEIIAGLLPVIESHYGKEDYTYSTLLSTLASIYAFSGQAGRALPLFEESSEVIRRLFGERHESYYNALNNLAMVYMRTERFAEAEALLIRSLQIRRELTGPENPAYVKALNNLAVMYLNMGGYERAAERFRQVAELSERLLGEASKSHLLALANLGVSYMRSGQLAAAGEVADKGEALLARHDLAGNRDFAEIHTLNLLTAMHSGTGDPELGRRIAESAAVLKTLYGERHTTYQNAINGLGGYCLKTGDYDRALEYASEDAGIVAKYRGKATSAYMKALSNKAAACYRLRRWQEAEAALAECLDVARRLAAGNLAFMSDREREDYWRSVRQPLDNISGLARAAFAGDYDSAALRGLLYDRSLLAKSLLLDYSANIREAVFASGDEASISLWRQLEKLRGNPKPDAAKVEELEKQLARRSAPYRNRRSDFSVTWREVQAQLGGDEAAVEITTVAGNGAQPHYVGLVLRAGDEAPQCVLLCGEEILASALHAPQHAASADLISVLFTPLEKHLRGVGRIYLSVSGLAGNVSFAGMKDRRGYLSDRYSLCNLLTTKDIAKSKQVRSFSETPASVLFGGADFGLPAAELDDAASATGLLRGQGFDYLPGSKKEAAEIGRILAANGWRSVVYTDKEATEGRFKALSSASPDVIHVSTHGYYFPPAGTDAGADRPFRNADDPMIRSGLLFSGANNAWNGLVTETSSDDGILTGREIASMDLGGTRLVVLSACSTALGDIDYSEGIYGLQRAFRIAGADALLVTLWEVPDRETTVFMTQFYAHLAEGVSVRDAFDATQRSMRREYAAKPGAWAGFLLLE